MPRSLQRPEAADTARPGFGLPRSGHTVKPEALFPAEDIP